jgi:hypothetical protein
MSLDAEPTRYTYRSMTTDHSARRIPPFVNVLIAVLTLGALVLAGYPAAERAWFGAGLGGKLVTGQRPMPGQDDVDTVNRLRVQLTAQTRPGGKVWIVSVPAEFADGWRLRLAEVITIEGRMLAADAADADFYLSVVPDSRFGTRLAVEAAP